MSILDLLVPATAFHSAEVPGLLSGMGIINTVTAFAYSTALNRVAGLKHRRTAAGAFGLAWLATLLVVLAYVLHSYWGTNTGLLVDAGLLVWVLSFPLVLVLIYLAARDSVGHGRHWFERDAHFADRFDQADFGVPVVDHVIRRAVQVRRRIPYPFLLIHDINSPGLRLASAFARSGIIGGEAVVYLTFSRPHRTIRRQVEASLEGGEIARRLWIIDCFSSVYMPEETARGGENVYFADPRDPSDVYAKYMKALRRARKLHESVRSIYETLSDFIKIADTDLVLHYLRRVVVLEESRHIRALYLFWDKAVQGGVDQQYLRWFFSTTLEMTMPDSLAEAGDVALRFENVFPAPVVVHSGPGLTHDESSLFGIRRERIEALAGIIRRLAYAPAPYAFLPDFQGPDRPMHLVNFLFFMVAIDHDTHRPGRRFESVLNGRLLHGSDLLYALAGRAKQRDPGLFLASSFSAVTDETVAGIFTAPNGCTAADLPGRARLFRNCATMLRAQYDGDARNLLQAAGRRLAGDGGLFDRLLAFEAYQDPIRKKPSLLVKVLMREGVFDPLDPDALDVAVDHVVMTMALRSGIVGCFEPVAHDRIARGLPLDSYQTAVLREVTRDAMRALCNLAGASPDRIDDLIWSYGRAALRHPAPLHDVGAIGTDLDGRLQASELPQFVAFLNGVDTGNGTQWPDAPVVKGPFTRFF